MSDSAANLATYQDPEYSGSVLYNRLTTPGARVATLPYGTQATPMMMPIARVFYDGANLAYDDLHPLFTGDVNAAPLAATAPGTWGQVVAAGRP